MKIFTFLFLLFSGTVWSQQHCGFDFTSYLVLHVHENGKVENIPDLKITLVDAAGHQAINYNNALSWSNSGKALFFTENYRIGSNGKRTTEINETTKWYFPYAKDTYLLSITNEFPADDYSVKIEDPQNIYKTNITQLHTYNMYVLCTGQQAMQFGRRINKPLEIVLERN